MSMSRGSVLAHSRTTTATLEGFPSSAEPQGTCILTTGAARPFPPPAGLTFSCWFLVSRHSSALEGHPLRFLTLVRHLARTEQPFVCFSISLCPDDLSLVVSTEEKEFQPLGRVLGPQLASRTRGGSGAKSAALGAEPRSLALAQPCWRQVPALSSHPDSLSSPACDGTKGPETAKLGASQRHLSCDPRKCHFRGKCGKVQGRLGVLYTAGSAFPAPSEDVASTCASLWRRPVWGRPGV